MFLAEFIEFLKKFPPETPTIFKNEDGEEVDDLIMRAEFAGFTEEERLTVEAIHFTDICAVIPDDEEGPEGEFTDLYW